MNSSKGTKYRHIVWDWNGTLLDDAWLCVEILNDILRKHNRPAVTLEQYRREFDFPVQDYYRRLGFDFAVESFDAIATEYVAQYAKRQFECRLQAQAVRILGAVRKLGLAQSILSAYQQDMLEEIVGYFGIRDMFGSIVGLNDYYAASKIENGRRLVEGLDCSSSQVLLIGDTVHDFETARAIGADCVLIANGHQRREKLEFCGARVLNSIKDVPTAVCGFS